MARSTTLRPCPTRTNPACYHPPAPRSLPHAPWHTSSTVLPPFPAPWHPAMHALCRPALTQALRPQTPTPRNAAHIQHGCTLSPGPLPGTPLRLRPSALRPPSSPPTPPTAAHVHHSAPPLRPPQPPSPHFMPPTAAHVQHGAPPPHLGQPRLVLRVLRGPLAHADVHLDAWGSEGGGVEGRRGNCRWSMTERSACIRASAARFLPPVCPLVPVQCPRGYYVRQVSPPYPQIRRAEGLTGPRLLSLSLRLPPSRTTHR